MSETGGKVSLQYGVSELICPVTVITVSLGLSDGSTIILYDPVTIVIYGRLVPASSRILFHFDLHQVAKNVPVSPSSRSCRVREAVR